MDGGYVYLDVQSTSTTVYTCLRILNNLFIVTDVIPFHPSFDRSDRALIVQFTTIYVWKSQCSQRMA